MDELYSVSVLCVKVLYLELVAVPCQACHTGVFVFNLISLNSWNIGGRFAVIFCMWY